MSVCLPPCLSASLSSCLLIFLPYLSSLPSFLMLASLAYLHCISSFPLSERVSSVSLYVFLAYLPPLSAFPACLTCLFVYLLPASLSENFIYLSVSSVCLSICPISFSMCLSVFSYLPGHLTPHLPSLPAYLLCLPPTLASPVCSTCLSAFLPSYLPTLPP